MTHGSPLERLYPLLLQGDTPVSSVRLQRMGRVHVDLFLVYPSGTNVSAALSWGQNESIELSDEGRSYRMGVDNWLRHLREENRSQVGKLAAHHSAFDVLLHTTPLHQCSTESMRRSLLEFGNRCLQAAATAETEMRELPHVKGWSPPDAAYLL